MRLLVSAILLSCVACVGDPAAPGDAARPRNLLLISADSLRVDRLSLWAGEGVETPALTELSERGVMFTSAWAVSPWTAPSMVSVFTGLYPPSHGVVLRDDTTPLALPTLPRIASENGLRVGNFSFFTGISYFRNLGFPPPAEGLSHGREPEVLAQWLDAEEGWDAAEGLEESEGAEPGAPAKRLPFFAWIHLLEPHLPYGASGYRANELQVEGSSGLEMAQLQATVPVGAAEFEPGDRARLLALYDSDIEKLDRRVAEISAVLEQRNLLEETLIVFVADHGDELLEDGWVGHASTSIEAKLLPEILRIPLLLSGPGAGRSGSDGESRPSSRAADAPQFRDWLVQQVDLLPTIIDAFGWSTETRLDGISLHRRPRRGFFGWVSRPRQPDLAFFDSSVGGNLTPVERRGERLQGVTDGGCLLRRSSAPGQPDAQEVVALAPADGECREAALAAALDSWRAEQAQRRLEVLQADSSEGAPDPQEAEGYPETLHVAFPEQGAELDWRGSGGQLVLRWQSEGEATEQEPIFWIQYHVGKGPLAVRGSFRVGQSEVAFGPFPEGFWNDLAGYSPFRFRVLDPRTRSRSEWSTFEVLPTVQR